MRWFASNIRTFLLAFVLSVSVWLFAVTSADPNEVRSPLALPLEIVGQDPSLIITNDIPDVVEVTLRAPRSVWDEITVQETPARAIIDLSTFSAGGHTADVQIQISDRPMQIILVNPESVTVQLERVSTRTLPVDLSLSGEPAIGYQAGEAVIDPVEVIVSGPESLVDQAARARVRVNIDGVRESIDQAILVQVLNSQNSVIDGLVAGPDSIHVSIPISQQGGFRDVAVKVVVTGQVAPGYRLENISVFPPVITVFASDPELVNSLPGVVDTQTLDLQDARENISTRLTLTLPQNITIVGSQTVEVQVGISPIQTSVRLLDQLINVTGLPDGLVAQVSPQTVDVIISGPLPVLDALTPQDIVVIVDATGLTAGTYQLTPDIEVLVDAVLVESILPGTIELVLSPPGTSTPSP
ncbi:MAG TPA: CdaR family protein [Anaerolineales bacterium]|nr:CdaR family protein [Anaerolineales bacterium]